MKKAYLVQLAAGLVFWISASTLAALAQSPPATTSPEDQLRIQELALRREAMDLDVKKTWISALGIGVPIFVAVLTLAGTVMAARGTMKAQFTAKVAELALQGEGPTEVLNRAKLLARLYEHLLPSDFANRVDALSRSRDGPGRIFTAAPWHAELKKEIIEQLAKYPQKRQQILVDYMELIPETKDYLRPLVSTSGGEPKAGMQVSAAPAPAEGVTNPT
jgi:hypothetical protein